MNTPDSTLPFLPYGRQWIDADDIDAVVAALKSDFLTTGPRIAEFERALCEYTGARYAVAVSNGTAALHLAVLALQIPPGASGITSPNTFVATSNALLYAGLRPRFADVDPATYVLSPDALADALDAEPAALVMPVHFGGNTAGIEQVSRIARQRGARVIEDAAHSLGGSYGDGARVGSCRYSDLTTFSFHPVKTMTTGEGGAVTTNDPELYERLVMLRSHGITRNADRLSSTPGPWYYEMQLLGYNYRITDIQAALGMSQLAKLDRFVARRREIVDRYNTAFADASWLTGPIEHHGHHTAWHLYVVRIDWDAIGRDRPSVMEYLRQRGVGTQVLYIPVHTQPYYRIELGFRHGDFPQSEAYYHHALALPLFPSLTDADQERVIDAVRSLGP